MGLILSQITAGHIFSSFWQTCTSRSSRQVWANFLAENLFEIGFKRSNIDKCVFYPGNLVFLVYVDDGIFVSLYNTSIDSAIKELMDSELKLEDQGHPADYLGVNTKNQGDGLYVFTQPTLTQQIIEDVCLGSRITPKPILICAQILLHHHLDYPPHDERKFQYQSVIGKLKYLAQCTWPDIVYAMHQCTQYPQIHTRRAPMPCSILLVTWRGLRA